MKTKGITIWEKYAEFLVLGVVFIVLVIYIIGQITSPNIKELAGEKIAPGAWHEKLKETGDAIKQKQNKPDVDDRVEAAIAAGEKTSSVSLQGFRSKVSSRIGPEQVAALPEYQLVPRIAGGDSEIAANSKFVDAQLPSASKPIVYQTFDLLSDGVVDEHETLQQIVMEAPHDISWLTVASEFDIAEAISRYTTAGSNGELPLPSRWHNGRIDLLDVRIERQELVDGNWTDSKIVDVMPGQFTLRQRLENESELGAEDRDEILGMLVDDSVSSQISQPGFYSTTQNRWLDPPEFLEDQAVNQIQQDDSLDASARLRQVKLRKLARLERDRDKLVEKYGEEAEGAGAGSGLGSSSGGGNSGGSRGGAGGGKDAGSDAAARARAKIKRLKEEIEELRKELGLDDEPEEDSGKADVQEGQEGDAADSTGWVWGYDITAQPGRTYRYRVALAVYNPLFARKLSLVKEQESLAESMIKLIDSSEWSEPVTVVPSLQVLAVRAMPSGYDANSGRLGYGEATAEVWRFYEGQWWPRRFSIQPGDVIGGIAPPDGVEPEGTDPIDFSTNWFVVDIMPRIGASKTDSRYGKGAKIIIQNMNNGSRMMIDPIEDAAKQRPETTAF
ncbi:MAG: hypothetical protein P8J89_10260 [Phycisphaerales bacterium]|nr:hypothetical protein [Phycisphaerales bacterium]